MTETNNAILLFSLNNQFYGLPISAIEVIVPIMSVQHVPQMPEDWLGIANIRGVVTPIIDLRVRFELPKVTPVLSSPVIVLRSEEHQVALLVDEVDQILHQSPAEQALDTNAPVKLHNGKVIVLLDAHAIIAETPLPTHQY